MNVSSCCSDNKHKTGDNGSSNYNCSKWVKFALQLIAFIVWVPFTNEQINKGYSVTNNDLQVFVWQGLFFCGNNEPPDRQSPRQHVIASVVRPKHKLYGKPQNFTPYRMFFPWNINTNNYYDHYIAKLNTFANFVDDHSVQIFLRGWVKRPTQFCLTLASLPMASFHLPWLPNFILDHL